MMMVVGDNMMIPLMLCFLAAVVVRLAVSLNSYSGQSKPPMFGDYEAQRHWMEITYHMHPNQWYVNSTNNDLQYWGLDYPPLTAYHSYLMGAVANTVNSSWVSLKTSHGIEDAAHKRFMRYTVILADVLCYIPAIIGFFCLKKQLSSKQKVNYSLLALLYPGLLLIDHGHFQYNCVSLGLMVWTVVAITQHQDVAAALLFTLAINYKQMELYHSLPFFTYLLGRSFAGAGVFLRRMTLLSMTVLFVFILCWLPFLTDTQLTLQVLHRLFPFSRGLYEDKVANVWCSMSAVVKLKTLLSREALIKICLLSTLGASLPSAIHLLCVPTKRNLQLSLVNVSLAFFLFSFQVHEKSILLVTIPALLLLSRHPVMCTWLLTISIVSMYPLLQKDGLSCATLMLTVMFLYLANEVLSLYNKVKRMAQAQNITIAVMTSVLLSAILMLCSSVIPPPSTLPDLWPVLISILSCAHFIIFMLYFNYIQIFTAEVVQN